MSNNVISTPFLQNPNLISKHGRDVIQAICDEEASQSWTPPATDDPLDPKRKSRVDFTYPEMMSQAEKIEETLSVEREAIREAAKHICQKRFNNVYMVGCGDSLAAMQGTRYFLEEVLECPCQDVQALDFAYYCSRNVNENTLVIMLSSSGMTLRTLEAMYMAQAKGAQTLTLSNSPNSILMKESTRGLIIHAERKGWPTQSSTSAMAMMYQLAIDMARERGYDSKRLDEFQSELDRTPDVMRQITKDCADKVNALACKLADKTMYLFAGAGPCYCSAFYGSAKIREATPNYALHIQLEEFHHYNSIKAGDPIIVIAPAGMGSYRALETLVVARNFGGIPFVVTTEGETTLIEAADEAFVLPPVMEYFAGLTYSIPVQMFGYYTAMEKFRLAEIEAATV